MANVFIKKIEKNAGTKEIVEYLDYLCNRITYILENIGEENLADDLNQKIGGR